MASCVFGHETLTLDKERERESKSARGVEFGLRKP